MEQFSSDHNVVLPGANFVNPLVEGADRQGPRIPRTGT
jgi:hypothetical protein